MKLLIILGILALFIALLYWRLRPYIFVIRRMLGMIREARKVNVAGATEPTRTASRTGEKLLRCAVCETWVPATRALTLRSSAAVYCSHACLERAAESAQPRRKSATKRW
ncbi:MAG TPA: hypothetical protein VD966_03070 [Pyrinomonadaceae bacterium]|nr:hypothetical protein [Pyrinomonadaceae bacterium]